MAAVSDEVPIACSLDREAMAERADRGASLAAASLLEASVTKRGVSMQWRGDAEADLRRLIAAESECCPFLDFELSREGSGLRLDVGSPEEAGPIIAELFGLSQSRRADSNR